MIISETMATIFVQQDLRPTLSDFYSDCRRLLKDYRGLYKAKLLGKSYSKERLQVS